MFLLQVSNKSYLLSLTFNDDSKTRKFLDQQKKYHVLPTYKADKQNDKVII